MLYEIESGKPLDQIDQALRDAAARHKFGVLGVHDLKQTMRSKGVEFDKEVRIYEVCNPHKAKSVLEANGAVSTALPCRISVYQSGDAHRIATILPTALMSMFGAGELQTVAEEVEATLKAIIAESA
jgi:uncharacterized protein (DUF302 family)